MRNWLKVSVNLFEDDLMDSEHLTKNTFIGILFEEQ